MDAAQLLDEQRLVEVSMIYEARFHEIKILQNDMKRGAPDRYKPVRAFQKLPRHLRRRTMSHNPYRIHSKALRQKAFVEMASSGNMPSKNSKRQYRRQKRRVSMLFKDFGKRQIDKQWLETHIWHAKRFHMINLWGHRIARTPTNKGKRAAFRSATQYNVIYDASHTSPISIVASQDSIIQLFQRLSPDCPIDQKMYLNGTKWGSFILRNPETLQLIGPVQFMWKPVNTNEFTPSRQVWLWVHPAAFHQILSFLQEYINQHSLTIQIESLFHKFQRFEILGPTANHVLYKTIEGINQEVQTKIKNILSFQPHELPSQLILDLHIKDPRRNTRGEAKVLEPNNGKPAPFLLKWPIEWAVSPLWDEEERNKLKCTVEDKHVHNPLLFKEKIQSSECHILLLQQTGEKGYCSGWTIIAPEGWGTTLWKQLVMSGGRAIGLEERQYLEWSLCCPVFPKDMPGSLAGGRSFILLASHILGQEEARRVEFECNEVWTKKPPAKRTNFEKLGVSSPFCIPWNILIDTENDQLTAIWIWMNKGGTHLRDMARIYHPKDTSKIIGFVSSGGYDYHRGLCKGFGYCRSKDIQYLLTELKQNMVLVRNLSSQWNHQACFTIAKPFH